MRAKLNAILTGVLLVVFLAVILSQLFGFASPVGYVSTDSMEPQLEPGDGYVGIPKPLAGDVAVGDVVTFQAQAVEGGGLITHRIVEKTDEGYITKGDANPFTDQASAEPPVPESNIVLVVAHINGNILAIPNLGDAAATVQTGVSSLIGMLGLTSVSTTSRGVTVGGLGVGLLIVNEIYNLVSENETRSMTRTVRRANSIDSRLVLVGLLLIISLPLVSATTIPSGTDDMQIVSTTTAQPSYDSRIKVGSYEEATMSIENRLPLPTVIIVEGASANLQVQEQVHLASGGETIGAKYTIWAAEEPGTQLRVRSVDFYLPVLPTSVIDWLHDTHPLLALGATTGTILSPVIILFHQLVGFRPILLRDTTR